MVEATTDIFTDAPEKINIDELDRLAEINYGKVLAVIKLRQKGATKLSKLTKDVFRCILESQINKILFYRYSDLYRPLEGQQDRHFPAIEKLDYHNYLVGVDESKYPNVF